MLNSAGLLTLLTAYVGVCALSFAGPAVNAAQVGRLCAPASSSTAGGLLAVKLGASLIASTVMLKVCGDDVSAPPFDVPPLSCSTSVIVAVPFASGAGVNVSVPVGETAGATLKRAAFVFAVTANVTV